MRLSDKLKRKNGVHLHHYIECIDLLDFLFCTLKFGSFLLGPTKNWIAVEGSHNTSYTLPSASISKQGSTSELNEQPDNMKIASSAPRGPQTFEERNVFAIYVSYYVKVKLTLSGMGGEVSLKLPFILGHVDDSYVSDIPRHPTTKISDCIRSKTPTEIVEEECGHDDITMNDDDIDNNDKEPQHANIDNTCNVNANQCDTIQLEEQLRFAHINANTSANNIHTANDVTDFDDEDDDAAKDTCHNIITAQIHHESHPNQSTEQITDC